MKMIISLVVMLAAQASFADSLLLCKVASIKDSQSQGAETKSQNLVRGDVEGQLSTTLELSHSESQYEIIVDAQVNNTFDTNLVTAAITDLKTGTKSIIQGEKYIRGEFYRSSNLSEGIRFSCYIK